MKNYDVDIIIFFIAIILAPICVTILTFWVFMVPVWALLFGWPYYVLFGAPLYWFMLRRYGPQYGPNLLVSWLALLAAPIIWFSVDWIMNGKFEPESFSLLGMPVFLFWFPKYIGLFVIFGVVFAPLWGATFICLYRFLTGQPYQDVKTTSPEL